MVTNIILVCQHGASTGLMVEKMLAAAKEMDVEAVINAYPESDLEKYIDDADLILLAPQVRFKLNSLQTKFGSKNIPFVVVDPRYYGMLDGKKVLEIALEELRQKGGS